jgi:phosphoglycerol transferase MdoB-like AlkP superfamily enzyme
MPPAILHLKNRLPALDTADRDRAIRGAMVAAIHLVAIAIMLATEDEAAAQAAYVFTWGLLNFFWLAVLRRPAAAAALSLAFIVGLILLSQLKHSVLFMTVNFVDLMIIDTDTFAFLLTVFPGLGRNIALAVAAGLVALILVWRLDPFRVPMRRASLGSAVCLVGLAGVSFAVPTDPYNEFYTGQYVSKFARSGVTAVAEYFTRGLLEADVAVADRLRLAPAAACRNSRQMPHIVMVFDESSFDLSVAPGVKVPRDYQRHFTSLDGKTRSLIVEGVGGPSWFTEYNALTGLSVRSYGRFADFVTRIAAGRVERGLPHTLRRCGYRTFSLYPFLGAFLSARNFQTTTGIQHFIDAKQLGAVGIEADGFYYDAAVKVIERERGEDPLFLFVYTAANHFPWTNRFRPDLLPGWRDLGNHPEADEYLRRQAISAQDYGTFVADLKRRFPGEPFLIVRFGDHQPSFARHLIDPAYDDSALARRIAENDVRFLTTYYSIDAVNFQPADLGSALETLDAPYLPLVVLEAAGLPLDPTFAEQKDIFERCRGLFYRCAGGAEARRFNRLLIDAGLIKGL